MYAGGGEHPLKEPCKRILVLIADQPGAFITDAEVLQEMMHRYLAIRRWGEGSGLFQWFATLMRDRVEPIFAEDVERAAELAVNYPDLSARDLLHSAVMQRLGLRQIVSADAGFDRLAGIERLDPADLPHWEASFAVR